MDRHTLPNINYDELEQCGRGKGGKAGGSKGGSRSIGSQMRDMNFAEGGRSQRLREERAAFGQYAGLASMYGDATLRRRSPNTSRLRLG
ncbi:hypothetical protein [Leptolyngbya ohadii]|uniref:hypothetical protein n=1 Tax=Leptolyngbya ohadii TaxID=1962290 RepID=UPI001179CC39|nr:hypothetical protein [Leptolyngbya ohadii]